MIIEKLNNGNVEISIKGIPKTYTGYYVIHRLVNSVGIYEGKQLLSEIKYTEIDEVVDKGTSLSIPTNNVELYNILRDRMFIHQESSDNASIDAFGNLRTSTTGQRFDCEFIYDKQSEIVDEVTVTGGAVTHDVNARDLTLAIINTTTATEARMASYPIPYTPGNSQKIDMTGVLDYANIGTGTASVFVRSKVSGTVVEEETVQSSWLSNTTGVNWNYSHILQMDFQSLKVGRIRFYLVQNGLAVKIHESLNDNVRNSGFWQSPSLPLYWRTYNDATHTFMEMGYGDENNGIGLRYKIAKNATAIMKAICGTVKSEGGFHLKDMQGYNRTADMGVTTVSVGNTLIPLISIRPKATFNSLQNLGLTIPIDASVLGDNPIKLVVLHNCTLTGAVWVDVNTNESHTEYDISATALSSGHELHSGYIGSGKNVTVSGGSLLGRTLLWDRQGTESGIITIAAIRTTTTSSDTLAAIRFSEIR